MEGESVRLRKVERADLALLHRWLNDRDLMAWARFSPNHMVSLEALTKEFERGLAGEVTDRTHFMIGDKASGRPIGWCVLRSRDRKHVRADVGVALGKKELWGKGYGTEAMRLLPGIAFDQQGWHHVNLWTLAANTRAVKSFEKCGFREVGVEREAEDYDGAYRDLLIVEQLKSEWDARKAR